MPAKAGIHDLFSECRLRPKEIRAGFLLRDRIFLAKLVD